MPTQRPSGLKTFERDYAYDADAKPTDLVSGAERATFQGFVRADGRVGTRNYVGVLTSVNCSATVARAIADAFRGDTLADYPNVDGVVALVHGTGCGMAGSGLGFELLQNTLDGYKRHPNFGGALMVGLGCEVNQIAGMVDRHGWEMGETFPARPIQDTGRPRAPRPGSATQERRNRSMQGARGSCDGRGPQAELT